MKTLQSVSPTDEQLKLMVRPRPGTLIIRGAAGSGKTTTSILMMKLSIGYFLEEFARQNIQQCINIRIFTFNKTLAAYVNDLVQTESHLAQSIKDKKLNIEVSTLAKYMRRRINGHVSILSFSPQSNLIQMFGSQIPLDNQFLVDEVEYLLGKLDEDKLESYIDMERTGRGTTPRVDRQLRRQILDQVVYPYCKEKKKRGQLDWNDIAVLFSKSKIDDIHIAIVDEAQDFSANQLKAITMQLADENFTTIVLDSNQKIYKRGFTWREAGINTSNARYARLEFNYRNTVEIAHFASKLIENAGITIDDDGTLPILDAIKRHGETPILLEGKFSQQMEYVLDYIDSKVDLNNETVGFLHAKGGGWFSGTKQMLTAKGLDFVEISGESEWPPLDTNIALSTIHSAKGLEFDHVFILGLEGRHFSFGTADSEDADYSSTVKLLSMGITRAKENVILGYKIDSRPTFIDHLSEATYNKVTL
ncbi:3'-5' exonuclease [Vibrio coralliirubri]|uniref:3'-5' exonuclease n=1 Tax=Vibrio coralliirubri TaxID=1516159 RepID=UPI000A36356B|nr:3'-5' exonuclease [Vibrio coralliirubri]